VAVIPARGGSRGVPGKNLRRVGGVPLIARAVAAAQASTLVDEVFVSTDDVGIRIAALAAGARVISRPAELAGDTASSESALLHALASMPVQPEVLVFVQATSPFIDPADLDGAVERVLRGESEVVFSACSSHAFLWRMDDAGQASGVNHDASIRLMRQQSEPQFRETGAFYVMRAEGFRDAGFRFFGRVGVAEVAPLGAIDIDTEDDLLIAEALVPLLDRDVAEPGPHHPSVQHQEAS
jgi:N-acylneuraminate cytidylyltransferase